MDGGWERGVGAIINKFEFIPLGVELDEAVDSVVGLVDETAGEGMSGAGQEGPVPQNIGNVISLEIVGSSPVEVVDLEVADQLGSVVVVLSDLEVLEAVRNDQSLADGRAIEGSYH